jgi:hypothetical protein
MSEKTNPIQFNIIEEMLISINRKKSLKYQILFLTNKINNKDIVVQLFDKPYQFKVDFLVDGAFEKLSSLCLRINEYKKPKKESKAKKYQFDKYDNVIQPKSLGAKEVSWNHNKYDTNNQDMEKLSDFDDMLAFNDNTVDISTWAEQYKTIPSSSNGLNPVPNYGFNYGFNASKEFKDSAFETDSYFDIFIDKIKRII